MSNARILKTFSIMLQSDRLTSRQTNSKHLVRRQETDRLVNEQTDRYAADSEKTDRKHVYNWQNIARKTVD